MSQKIAIKLHGYIYNSFILLSNEVCGDERNVLYMEVHRDDYYVVLLLCKASHATNKVITWLVPFTSRKRQHFPKYFFSILQNNPLLLKNYFVGVLPSFACVYNTLSFCQLFFCTCYRVTAFIQLNVVLWLDCCSLLYLYIVLKLFITSTMFASQIIQMKYCFTVWRPLQTY